MAGKARVHELAKELGVTSKEVLARLSEQGEFVKSASSTVEAPVARRLRESLGGAKPAAEKAKADGNGAPAKKAAPAKAPPRRSSRACSGQAGRPAAPAPAAEPADPPTPAAPAPAATAAAPAAAPARPGPTPGPRPATRRPQAGERAHRASATTRSPRRSPSSGRFRGRRHPDRARRGPVAARVPAPRRAICRPVPRGGAPGPSGTSGGGPRPAPGGRGPGGGRRRRRSSRRRWRRRR